MGRRNLYSGSLVLVIATVALPALAQTANFEALELARGFSRSEAVVSGHTGGNFSLDQIAVRDSQGQRCMGFGSQTPDHMMTLREDFGPLSLTVNSGGNDTTLVVQGPNNWLLCGDDSGQGKDAMVQAEAWPAGTYRVWIGSFQPGERWRYRLMAQ